MKIIEKKELVILTKKFGYNFTGATLATHELIKRWVDYFSNITVITKEIGKYDRHHNLTIIKANSTFEIIKLLNETKNLNAIYYSDDHLGFLMKLCGIEYYHTYHGNWPDAKKVSLELWLKSLFFMPAYKLSLKNAKLVINVSYYMEKYTRKYNKYTTVIRNGLGQKKIDKQFNGSVNYVKKIKIDNRKLKIIMIGGIDKRKYKLAIKLFSVIKNKSINDRIHVDIYGGVNDKNIGDLLKRYDFVKLKGYVDNIDLKKYDILLSTSEIENLSISICEAIANNIPVLCFNVGGLGEVVKNARNGFIIPNGDVNTMANIIEHIVSNGYTFEFNHNMLFEYDWEFASKEYLRQFSI
ncbi:glycosyltransferase [Geobacillus kaustophilus NBRC 102445]|uniref:glycosyltransferase family 4 protein n=1 Tax=Geobacillus thermoleovorans group TaxID=1505648 RepID=UPI0005A9272D|nr:glycosyltransferase family 4 protein [Geobacillus kaustophilus]MED4974615.1 glycosyltransferase family 4 protein [Geobacillus thermoleovorans]QCK81230.1 glycosyltransferase [Geobacillus kaustophilus NBRC 102445]